MKLPHWTRQVRLRSGRVVTVTYERLEGLLYVPVEGEPPPGFFRWDKPLTASETEELREIIKADLPIR